MVVSDVKFWYKPYYYHLSTEKLFLDDYLSLTKVIARIIDSWL